MFPNARLCKALLDRVTDSSTFLLLSTGFPPFWFCYEIQKRVLAALGGGANLDDRKGPNYSIELKGAKKKAETLVGC